MHTIVDYLEKDIDFCVYDFPYKYVKENENLKKYKIRGITITHKITEIEVFFNIKDTIPAVGIIINKYNSIMPSYHDDLILFLKIKDTKYELSLDEEVIYEKIKAVGKAELSLLIYSKTYNLEKEKNLICYYNLNDEYEDTILDEILKEISA